MKAILALRAVADRYPTLLVATGPIVLGRSSKCDLVVKHDTVSRMHAEITPTQNALDVRDLQSRNGTLIDSHRVLTGTVRVGQKVTFGSVAFSLILIEAGIGKSNSDHETAECGGPPAHDSVDADLSKAQRRVLVQLLRGLPEKQVAGQLKISPTTVHNHIQAIYRAYKVHSRSELLVLLLDKEASR